MDYNDTSIGELETIYRSMLGQLSPKHQVYVEEYLVDLDATKAAIRAGYSKRSARKQGLRMSRKQEICECIDVARELRSRKTGVTVEWVLNELKTQYEQASQAVPVLDRQGNEVGQWKADHAAANRSLELIGRYLGMFGEGKDKGGDKHLHLHDERYVNSPPMPKTVVEWVEQMNAIGLKASIAPIQEEAGSESEVIDVSPA